MSYEEWVRAEARKINSDGCTGVEEWHSWCCLEHDLGCHYGKDARVAYDLGWNAAPKLSRRAVDIRFLNCNRARSNGFWDRLRSDIRFLGVRIGAYLGIGVRK